MDSEGLTGGVYSKSCVDLAVAVLPPEFVLSAQSDPYECYMSENLIFPYINCTQVSELQVNVHYTYIYMYVMSTRGRPIMI